MKFHNLLIYRFISQFLLRLSIVLSTAVMIVALGCSVPPEPAASDSRDRSGAAAKDDDISEAEVKLSRVEPQTVLGDDLSSMGHAQVSAADAAVAGRSYKRENLPATTAYSMRQVAPMEESVSCCAHGIRFPSEPLDRENYQHLL
jgi:hypothetical protein